MGARIKTVIAGIGVAAGMALAIPTGVAQATEEVSCNSGSTVQLDINLGGGIGTKQCYAKPGVLELNPRVGGVFRISSGRYKPTVNYERNGHYYTSTFGPSAHINFTGTVRVYEVRIW